MNYEVTHTRMHVGGCVCACVCVCVCDVFLMVPRVILEIRLNLGRKFVCVYVPYNCELLMPCIQAAIMSAL